MVSFLQKITLKFYAKYQLWDILSAYEMEYDVLQGETYIAPQVFDNIPQMYKNDWKEFW